MGIGKIFLETINRSLHKEQFIGNNSRLATCTGVKIIDDNHLVTTHFVGQKMYLYEFWEDNGRIFQSKLLDSIDTTLNNEIITTDLLDYNDGRIMTSNCDFASTSLYIVLSADDKISGKLKDPTQELYQKDQKYQKLNQENLETIWTLKKVRDYEEPFMGFCHGTKFYPYNKDLFVAMSYKPSYCIYFKSL